MAAEKMPPLPPLHALRAFDAAARYGRFREAAKALGLSESAVSHQVKKLEDFLSVALFERRGNAVSLTPAGQRYFEQIEPAFVRIRSATEDIRGPLGHSRVALTLPGTLATFWLIPKLHRLDALHPDISLQLLTTDRISDLRREQIHLAIRYGRAPWPGVVSEHLLDEQAFPVCKPGFVPPDLVGRPGEAVRKLRLIVNDTHVPEWQEWARGHGLEPPSLRGAIMLHASDQVLGAAIEGLGMAIGRRPLVDHWLSEGRLVAPFGAADLSGAAYYLAWPDDVDLPVAARKVARWLHDMAREEATKTAANSTP